MKSRISVMFVATVLLLATNSRVFADDSNIGSKVWKQGLKSSVWVVHVMPGGYAMGSGSLIDYKQKLIVTNYHVATTAKVLQVMFPMFDQNDKLITDKDAYLKIMKKNGGYVAEVLFAEKKRDLAIIRLRPNTILPKGIVAIELATEEPTPGDMVHSIGSPGDSDGLFCYTPGNVKNVYVKKWFAGGGADGFEVDARIVEATSPTNHGDSGGPLLNNKCQQIGVTQGGKNVLAANSINYFIATSEIRGILKDHKITLSGYRGPGTNTVDPDTTTTVTLDGSSDPNIKPTKTDTANADKPSKDPVPAKDTAKPSAPSADEEKANKELTSAKNLIDQGKKDFAKKYLARILENYPNTKAAKEARELAKQLDN